MQRDFYHEEHRGDKNKLITPADVYPLKDYQRWVEQGLFTDYDGVCEPVVISISPVKFTRLGNISYRPSQIDQLPENTTHVIWYNR